jgi:hypothetical protein
MTSGVVSLFFGLRTPRIRKKHPRDGAQREDKNSYFVIGFFSHAEPPLLVSTPHMETPTAAFKGDDDIPTAGASGQDGCAGIMPVQKERAAKWNYVNWLRLPRTQASNRNSGKFPWHWNQACASPPELNWWRKDLRSIPKVFLIDADEVS